MSIATGLRGSNSVCFSAAGFVALISFRNTGYVSLVIGLRGSSSSTLSVGLTDVLNISH